MENAPGVAQERLLETFESLLPAEQKRFADTFAQILDAMGAEKNAPMIFEDNDNTTTTKRKHKRP